MNSSLAPWETYSPFSVGLESFFNQLDKIQDSGKNFPPYNIVREDENNHTIEIALAGYSQDQLEVSVEKHILTVRGERDTVENKDYSYRGLALRSFQRSWTLADDVIIEDVQFVNGLLSIRLKREVPEQLKKKVLPINTHIETLKRALEAESPEPETVNV